MRLTQQQFRIYILSLKQQNVQVLHVQVVQEKLKNNEQITVYIGYEPSGEIHLGHLSGILMLEQFSKYDNVRVLVVISTFHAKANKKILDYTLLKQMKIAHSGKNIEHILSSTTELTSNSSRNNYMYTADYINKVFNQTTKIRFKKLIKATAFFERQNYTDLTISQVLYPIYQAVDIEYLNIDIAIGRNGPKKNTHVSFRQL